MTIKGENILKGIVRICSWVEVGSNVYLYLGWGTQLVQGSGCQQCEEEREFLQMRTPFCSGGWGIIVLLTVQTWEGFQQFDNVHHTPYMYLDECCSSCHTMFYYEYLRSSCPDT